MALDQISSGDQVPPAALGNKCILSSKISSEVMIISKSCEHVQQQAPFPLKWVTPSTVKSWHKTVFLPVAEWKIEGVPHYSIFKQCVNFQTWTCQSGLGSYCWGWEVQKSLGCIHVRQLVSSALQTAVAVCVSCQAGWQFHHLAIALLVGRHESRAPCHRMSLL